MSRVVARSAWPRSSWTTASSTPASRLQQTGVRVTKCVRANLVGQSELLAHPAEPPLHVPWVLARADLAREERLAVLVPALGSQPTFSNEHAVSLKRDDDFVHQGDAAAALVALRRSEPQAVGVLSHCPGDSQRSLLEVDIRLSQRKRLAQP